MKQLEWSVADAIMKMRSSAQLDQAQLAEIVGVSRSSISNYERGLTLPHNFKTVQRMAVACGYDPDDPTLRRLWETARSGTA